MHVERAISDECATLVERAIWLESTKQVERANPDECATVCERVRPAERTN